MSDDVLNLKKNLARGDWMTPFYGETVLALFLHPPILTLTQISHLKRIKREATRIICVSVLVALGQCFLTFHASLLVLCAINGILGAAFLETSLQPGRWNRTSCLG